MQPSPLQTYANNRRRTVKNAIKNTAFWSALQQAFDRAKRDQKPMAIYIAPPGSPCAIGNPNDPRNVYYVRPVGDPRPVKSHLFRVVKPVAQAIAA